MQYRFKNRIKVLPFSVHCLVRCCSSRRKSPAFIQRRVTRDESVAEVRDKWLSRSLFASDAGLVTGHIEARLSLVIATLAEPPIRTSQNTVVLVFDGPSN